MARQRTLKPGFFTNEDLGACSPLARLLFAGMWCWADRLGRTLDRPRRLKAEILPYDAADGEALVSELARAGMIRRYSVGETAIIQIVKFLEHQDPHPRETPSILPNEAGEFPSQGQPKANPRGAKVPPRSPSPSRPSGSEEEEACSELAEAPASEPDEAPSREESHGAGAEIRHRRENIEATRGGIQAPPPVRRPVGALHADPGGGGEAGADNLRPRAGKPGTVSRPDEPGAGGDVGQLRDRSERDPGEPRDHVAQPDPCEDSQGSTAAPVTPTHVEEDSDAPSAGDEPAESPAQASPEASSPRAGAAPTSARGAESPTLDPPRASTAPLAHSPPALELVAPSRAKAKPKPEPPDPRKAALREIWEAEFLTAIGGAYRWLGAKDACAIRSLVAVDPAEFRARARKALRIVGYGRCTTVAQLNMRWNDLAGPGGPGPPTKPRVIAAPSNFKDPAVRNYKFT